MIITRLTSSKNSVTIRRDGPTIVIGERINPTGRKDEFSSRWIKAYHFNHLALLSTFPR